MWTVYVFRPRWFRHHCMFIRIIAGSPLTRLRRGDKPPARSFRRLGRESDLFARHDLCGVGVRDAEGLKSQRTYSKSGNETRPFLSGRNMRSKISWTVFGTQYGVGLAITGIMVSAAGAGKDVSSLIPRVFVLGPRRTGGTATRGRLGLSE